MKSLGSDHPLFEVVATSAGAISIRNKILNETMHNPIGPWVEANLLYIDQSHLKQRLAEQTHDEFVIFDVGLGAAANALAALAAVKSTTDRIRPVRIVSFERDLELLKFALENSHFFEHFKGYEEILKTVLESEFYSDGWVSWELRHGDFLEFIEMEKHRPHLVFFDPYSSKVNEEMWTTSCFRKIKAIARLPEEGATLLYTYSRATRIRVSLIEAGFFVGYGTPTGLKTETTEASTDPSRLHRPLDREWFERWKKSHLRYPYDCKPDAQIQLDQMIESLFNSYLTATI